MFCAAELLKRLLMSASVLALMIAPALAQSSRSTTTETTRPLTTPSMSQPSEPEQPIPPISGQQPSTSDPSRIMTSPSIGVEKQALPGDLTSPTKTIEQQPR
jgi:hypothetical protein